MNSANFLFLKLNTGNMNVDILPSSDRATINWSSGTSTEIYIHPHDGNFAERNFLFRISTATVEAEESTFTFFEGITRHLMILEGEVELEHVDRYTKTLKPLEQDSFSGEWDTRSKGKVTDFNLMCKGATVGNLTPISLEEGEKTLISKRNDFCFVYVVSGVFTFAGTSAFEGDLIHLKGGEMKLTSIEDGDLIHITVDLND